MLLQYLGVDISVDDFIAGYLQCRDFEEREGELYGPDPRRYFCGSPYDEDSFGCYAPVICRALKQVLGDEYEVTDETGTEMEVLISRYIDQGMPVVFWACIEMREPVTGPQWRLTESGEIFTWISNEHCMLLVGYDEDGYWFNDPYGNRGVIHYSRELTENRHCAQYMQAVAVRKAEK